MGEEETQEEKQARLNDLRDKLKKISEERQVNPTLQESKDSSPSFARAVMRGGIRAVLALEDEEAKQMVINEAGLSSLEAFLATDRKKWDSEEEGLPEVFRATMAGVYRGILKLGDEDKKTVLKAMGEACFNRFLWSFRNWEAAGIPMAPGSHDIDEAAIILESGLTVREVNRVEDTIFWRGKTGSRYDHCACCLVLAGITPPVPEVCQCASWHMKKMWEYHTGLPMEAQLVETINTGSDGDCVFRINIKPSQYTARD